MIALKFQHFSIDCLAGYFPSFRVGKDRKLNGKMHEWCPHCSTISYFAHQCDYRLCSRLCDQRIYEKFVTANRSNTDFFPQRKLCLRKFARIKGALLHSFPLSSVTKVIMIVICIFAFSFYSSKGLF